MSSSDEPKCPVDPATRDIWLRKSKAAQAAQHAELDALKDVQSGLINTSWSWKNLFWASSPVNNTVKMTAQGCPVPHNESASMPNDHPQVPGMITKSEPEAFECKSDEIDQSLTTPSFATEGSQELGEDRVISSIPRTNTEGNWVYPSEKQFFNAMIRKNWDPQEDDMKTVVPLHNMVNEIAWKYVLQWEKSQGNSNSPIELTSFKGDAKKLTPRAMINHYIFGKDLPFDRHDWTVSRDGKQVEYVIDFYTTKVQKEGEEPKFYMDVRPKLNSVEGVKMRILQALGI